MIKAGTYGIFKIKNLCIIRPTYCSFSFLQ